MSSSTLLLFSRRVLSLSAVAIGLAGVAACGSTADQAETAASPDRAVQVEAQHAGGLTGVFVDRALALDLRADQRTTIQGVQARLHELTAPVRSARAALDTEVAAEVRAGKLDKARLQPLADAVTAAVATTKPAVQQATQQIHDTLDASQRKALVASMRDRASHAWGHGQGKAHMDQVAAELGLTDDQRATIKGQMQQAFAARAGAGQAEHAAGKARMQALATAFESDAFDAKALDVGAHGAEGAKQMMGVHGVFLAAAVPVLTPAQREILATKIEKRAEALED